MSEESRRFVYVLESVRNCNRHHVGLTSSVTERLSAHNAALSPHTAKYRPWERGVSLEFGDESKAIRFEKYLISGSDRAFAKRHF